MSDSRVTLSDSLTSDPAVRFVPDPEPEENGWVETGREAGYALSGIKGEGGGKAVLVALGLLAVGAVALAVYFKRRAGLSSPPRPQTQEEVWNQAGLPPVVWG